MLWSVGVWLLIRRRPPWIRLVVGSLLSLLTFFSHLSALVLYAAAVVGIELQDSARTLRDNFLEGLRNLVVGAAQFAVPALVFVLFSPTSDAANQGIHFHLLSWPAAKPLMAIRTLNLGHPTIDSITPFVLAIGVALLLWRGKPRFLPTMYTALGLFVLAFILAPSRMLSAESVDTRIPIAIMFLAIASSNVNFKSEFWGRVWLFGALVFLVVRVGFVSSEWSRADHIISTFTSAFETLPPASVVFVVSEAPYGGIMSDDKAKKDAFRPSLKHIASLATLKSPVLAASTFVSPFQQPLSLTDRYRPLDEFKHERGPIRVTTSGELTNVIEDFRKLVAKADLGAGKAQSPPIFLLLIRPDKLRDANPNYTTRFATGEYFVLLRLVPLPTKNPVSTLREP